MKIYQLWEKVISYLAMIFVFTYHSRLFCVPEQLLVSMVTGTFRIS